MVAGEVTAEVEAEVDRYAALDALARSRAAGVSRLLVPGTTLADSARAVALARENEGVVAAVGVHPHDAKDFETRTQDKLEPVS